MTLSHYLCVIVILLGHFSSFTYGNNMSYTLDVLCCQPIKLIQAVSTSEFHEYQCNNVVFIFFVPSGFWRASEAANIDCFKN